MNIGDPIRIWEIEPIEEPAFMPVPHEPMWDDEPDREYEPIQVPIEPEKVGAPA